MQRQDEFDLPALYAALDEQRRARRLTWAEFTRQMNGRRQPHSGHALSSSTVTCTPKRAMAEGDGVLQMLRWLNRSPESFLPGSGEQQGTGARLPDVPRGRVLRFDTKKLHTALDDRRMQRELTWAALAREVDMGTSSLTRLSKGGRTCFPQVMRLVRWLGRPAADFTRIAEE